MDLIFRFGGEAAVARAAIMGGLALYSRELGRRSAGLNTLAFTAAVMCAFNPNLSWDPSFQLSFMATLGLVLYADPPPALSEAFKVTGTAHIIAISGFNTNSLLTGFCFRQEGSPER